MNRLIFALLLPLTACQQAVADSNDPEAVAAMDAAVVAPDQVPENIAATPFYSATEGVGAATDTLKLIRADLQALPADQRATVQASAQSLIANCPYNRGGAQLPLVLQQVLASHDDPTLAALKAGVDEHVAVLELMGVKELPLAQPGDYLHRQLAGLVTADQLAASADPIATTHLLIAEIEGLVADYDSKTLATIEAANEVVLPPTHAQWPMKGQLVSFRTELEQIAETTKDAALRDDTQALAGMLSAYMLNGC